MVDVRDIYRPREKGDALHRTERRAIPRRLARVIQDIADE